MHLSFDTLLKYLLYNRMTWVKINKLIQSLLLVQKVCLDTARVGRYVNDFCSSEPLNFGESRLWVKGPRGHASRGKSEGKPERPTEPLMKFRPSRTELSEASRNEAWETLQFRSVSLKEQIIYAPLLRNHFCQKEQTPYNICIAAVF